MLLMENQYDTVSADQNRSKARRTRLRQTALQALFYVLAWMNTYLWVGVARALEDLGASDGFFAIRMMSAIFYPLQGFFNFLIFVRPRLHDLRQRYPNESSSGLWKRVLSAQPGTYRRSGASMSRLSLDSSFRGGVFWRPPSLNSLRGWMRSSMISLSSDNPQQRKDIGRSDDDSIEIPEKLEVEIPDDLEDQMTNDRQPKGVAESFSVGSEECSSYEDKIDEGSSKLDPTEIYDHEPTSEKGTDSSDINNEAPDQTNSRDLSLSF